ncbi:permease, partial [Vibrio alginolyticus]|uniref:permease n=1 Tax=Vibrio alginolyticus TaxID=663 RepID=UPI00215D544D
SESARGGCQLGAGQWWSVPVSVLIGIPLYSNATGVIPIMESLLRNGLPISTTLAFCMSTVAASIPEFVMLKQVIQWRLTGISFWSTANSVYCYGVDI